MIEEPETPDRQADDRLLHALLLHQQTPQAAEGRNYRLNRALQALRNPSAQHASDEFPAPRNLPFPTWARRSAWAAAAILLVAVSIFALTYNSRPALASLNDILTALNHPGDHAFLISVDPPDPAFMPRAGLDRATLYLRDGKQYLLVRPDYNGGSLFDGFDGRQSWRISGGALAETREGLGAGGLGMPENMTDTLFSNLQPTLERIRVDYTVEQLNQAPLPPRSATTTPTTPTTPATTPTTTAMPATSTASTALTSPPLRHLLARRNSPAIKGPVTIEIWANLTSGLPQRIVFDQAKFQGSDQSRRLTFDLTAQSTLPPDWFTPARHLPAKPASPPTRPQ